MVLENLKPSNVFRFFEEISAIPRGSKKEQAISDYLYKFGIDRNLETIQDDVLNVIIKKDGTPGYEDVPPVILQGHMDMVWEKNLDTDFDFDTQGLNLYVDGDFIKAKGTTLGGDNGIAVAFALALLDSKDIPHPPLEVLLTSDEETGMTGAQHVDPSHFKGKYLLNIDTEEEGEIYVSCAGGNRTESHYPVKFLSLEETNKDGFDKVLDISIRGLVGGHSGMDIIAQRGNANKIMGSLLKNILKKMEFRLISIAGGSKDNAIPREGDCSIVIKSNELEKFEDLFKVFVGNLKEAYRGVDDGLEISFKDGEEGKEIMDQPSTTLAINGIFLHPDGVQRMSLDIPGLVESSINLGIVTTKSMGNNLGTVNLSGAARSSDNFTKKEITTLVEVVAESLGGTFFACSSYPAWKYNPESKLRTMALEVYKNTTGKEAGIKAIHAGLECGLLSEKLPDCDMISFGPDMFDVHTPGEKLSISSVERVWNFFLEIMKESKNYL